MGQFSTKDLEYNDEIKKIVGALMLVYRITFEDQMGLDDCMLVRDGEYIEYDDLNKFEKKLLDTLGECLEKNRLEVEEKEFA